MSEKHPDGFRRHEREPIHPRAPRERRDDYREIYAPVWSVEQLQKQGERCMDCGVPACMAGCPLGNRIPEWNDLVSTGDWQRALQRLHATNNFPEFTGYTCPAPCEPACTLAISDESVTIKNIERAIVDRGWHEGWIRAEPPANRTDKTVAVVGSGPAGLACAQQLNRAGHRVTVFERDEVPGGLMVHGIPDFKFEKHRVERRVQQLRDEGIAFRTGINIGKDVTIEKLKQDFDAVCLAVGAQQHRRVDADGADLDGVVYGMDYLVDANRFNAKRKAKLDNDAKGLHVVVLGGGDTGADCVATAHRQGAASVTQVSINPPLSAKRSDGNPWPEWPETATQSYALDEGGEAAFSLDTLAFGDRNKDGRVDGVLVEKVEWQRENGRRVGKTVLKPAHYLRSDLVLIAIGFSGVEKKAFEKSMLSFDRSGRVKIDASQQSSMEGVFAAGDAARGQSLVVWAIASGREAAREIHRYLESEDSLRPSVRTANPPLGARDVDLVE